MDEIKITAEDSRQYVLMLQDIIKRMAGNSTNCKVWTVSLVTALTAMIAANAGLRMYMPVILIPIAVFYFLDVYYLGFEKAYRNLQSSYIKKLKSTDNDSDSIYNFNYKSIEENKNNVYLKDAFKSASTWLFYSALALVVIICYAAAFFIKEPTVQNLEKPLNEIVLKQDTIIDRLEDFTDKYTPTPPVHVTEKTYNKSSFFKADNVDSVQVKVYGNK